MEAQIILKSEEKELLLKLAPDNLPSALFLAARVPTTVNLS